MARSDSQRARSRRWDLVGEESALFDSGMSLFAAFLVSGMTDNLLGLDADGWSWTNHLVVKRLRLRMRCSCSSNPLGAYLSSSQVPFECALSSLLNYSDTQVD